MEIKKRKRWLIAKEEKAEPLTMYIQNRRNGRKFKGYSPLQLHLGLIRLKPAIVYISYTKRCVSY